MPKLSHFTALLAGALLTSNCLAAPPPSIAPLLSSIQERLAIADNVALSKWDSGKPVEDRPRERDVIAAAAALAPTYSVTPALAEQFFSAQIEANKLVQYAHLAQWSLEGKAPASPRLDLSKEIRPHLDELQHRLLQQLRTFAPLRTDKQCPMWLAQATQAADTDELHRLALTRATAELCVR